MLRPAGELPAGARPPAARRAAPGSGATPEPAAGGAARASGAAGARQPGSPAAGRGRARPSASRLRRLQSAAARGGPTSPSELSAADESGEIGCAAQPISPDSSAADNSDALVGPPLA